MAGVLEIGPNLMLSFNANTPFIDSLYKKYPHCELKTFGEHVGLPKGQMGNSEVGHLNIGAGRIVYQDLAKKSIWLVKIILLLKKKTYKKH